MKQEQVDDVKKFFIDRKNDIALLLSMIVLSYFISQLPTGKIIPDVNDPNYSYPKYSEHVPRFVNVTLNFYIPLVLFIVVSIMKKDIVGLLHLVLAFYFGDTTVAITIALMKKFSAKPRPYYNTICIERYSPSCNESFPSGHTAYSFEGQLFVTLYLYYLLQPYKISKNLGFKCL